MNMEMILKKVNRKIVRAFALIFCNFSKQQKYCTFSFHTKYLESLGLYLNFTY